MDGVPEANELNPGGYVPLNADNDNRSQVTLRLAQTQDRAVRVVRLLPPVGRDAAPLQTQVERASS